MVNGSVYLDEAGNTGLNFLDPTQPTYVLGGWIVRADQVEAASAAVAAVAEESGSRDLKGSRMMRSVPGRRRVERIVRDLRQLGCYPVYSLYEKHYAVAAKIVETFLDSVYNDRLLSSFDADIFAKQAVAQELYDLPAGSLTPAWEAIRAADAERMRDSLNALVERCRLLGLEVLAQSLAGAKSHVVRIATVLAELREDPVTRQGEALPGTSLITIAGAIDSIAKDMDLTRLEVVHDETSSFEPNLEWWFQLVSGPAPAENPSDIVFAHGRAMRVGYSVVRSLRFAVSEEEPLVQAADVLVGLLATLPRRLAGEIDQTNPGLADEYAQLALLSDIGHPVPCTIVGSNQFREEIARVITASDLRRG